MALTPLEQLKAALALFLAAAAGLAGGVVITKPPVGPGQCVMAVGNFEATQFNKDSIFTIDTLTSAVTPASGVSVTTVATVPPQYVNRNVVFCFARKVSTPPDSAAPPAPVVISLNPTNSLRVEQQVPLVIYQGDALLTLVQTGADSLSWDLLTYANKDSAMKWASMVDSISAIASPDSIRIKASGMDTLVAAPAGGEIHYNSDVLLFQRTDLGKGAGVQNYLSIGIGPSVWPYTKPGSQYYGTAVFGPVVVPRATLLQLTAAIRTMAKASHSSVAFPPPRSAEQ